MEMGTIRTKVSRSHSEIRTFLSLTFCCPNPTYDIYSKTRLKGNGQKDHYMAFKTNYRLMQVKSIAECFNGSILQDVRPS